MTLDSFHVMKDLYHRHQIVILMHQNCHISLPEPVICISASHSNFVVSRAFAVVTFVAQGAHLDASLCPVFSEILRYTFMLLSAKLVFRSVLFVHLISFQIWSFNI